MLSPHALLIAAIFVPYMTLMAGLGYYIWRTGQPPASEPPQPDGDREPEPADLRLAA